MISQTPLIFSFNPSYLYYFIQFYSIRFYSILIFSVTPSNESVGVLRDNGGHAVALRWTMENIYGMKSGDVFWAAR